MYKAVLGAVIGIAIIMLGFFVWYTYITTLQHTPNGFLFWLAISQVGIGTFILFWASGSSDPFRLHAKKHIGSVDVIEESNKIYNELSTKSLENEQIKFVKIVPKKN